MYAQMDRTRECSETNSSEWRIELLKAVDRSQQRRKRRRKEERKVLTTQAGECNSKVIVCFGVQAEASATDCQK